MSFFEYLLPYYDQAITKCEQELERIGEEAGHDSRFIALLTQASNLMKFLQDIREEGYEATYQTFVRSIDAVERLGFLVNRGVRLCHAKDEASLLYLLPEKFTPTLPPSSGKTHIYELDTYLEKLARLDYPDLDKGIWGSPQFSIWRERLEILLDEMVKYVDWLCVTIGNRGGLFLLRDTLLPYLGFRVRQKSAGATGQALPIFISRKFLAAFGDGGKLFNRIADPIYDILLWNDRIDFPSLQARYQKLVGNVDDRAFLRMRYASEHYLETTLAPHVEYFVVESGVQGSIPLFVTTLSRKIRGFLMYTTVPWLYEIYGSRIFNPNYNYLRDMETLLCHDRLFEFHAYAGDKILIRERQDEVLRTLAYYEVVRFKEKIETA